MPDDSSTISSSAVKSYACFNDPLYLSQSDQPSLKLTSAEFDGSDFLSWKREAYLALISKNKEGFIDGTFRRPPSTHDSYHQWIRCDLLVMKCLEVYQLRKELVETSQANTPLVEYYNKLKRTWETLDALDPVPLCNCGAIDACTCQLLKRMLDRESNTKLIQFLMGLNSSFEATKTNVLNMEPLPPLHKAYSLLQKVERHKQIATTVDVLAEATAYAASSSDPRQGDWKKARTDGSDEQPVKICSNCNFRGHDVTECHKLMTCEHWGKKGHIIDFCFDLTRNKNKYKGKGPYKTKPATTYLRPGSNVYKRAAHNVDNVDVCEADSPLDFTDNPSSSIPGMTVAGTSGSQCNAAPFLDPNILNSMAQSIYQQVMKTFSDNNNTPASVNFAGMVPFSYANSASSLLSFHNWIVDTGASDHMTPHAHLLHDVYSLKYPILIALPDGTMKTMHKAGKMRINSHITLHNVFIVPDFKQNLLSVGRLSEQLPLHAIFTENLCIFQDLSSKVTCASAKKIGGLFRLLSESASVTFPLNANKSCNVSVAKDVVHTSNLKLFHARIGHSSVEKLRHVPESFHGMKDFFWETCILAKHHNLPFPGSTSHALHCFDLIHMNLWGPYKVKSVNGASYFLTIVDDCSRSTWTYLLNNKEMVPGVVKGFLKMVETQFGTKVEVLRSDHGTEFV
ncbi:uncharacterized protein LOC141638035 [Silene latifolia]|uniref:uncharacterized protein LOC141638035 n=1 Tax=Silene latifolia TaxID=37657 RepID=UPI003D77DD7D